MDQKSASMDHLPMLSPLLLQLLQPNALVPQSLLLVEDALMLIVEIALRQVETNIVLTLVISQMLLFKIKLVELTIKICLAIQELLHHHHAVIIIHGMMLQETMESALTEPHYPKFITLP